MLQSREDSLLGGVNFSGGGGGRTLEDTMNLWVKYSNQNVVSIVSRRKDSKMFPCGLFF